MQGKLLAQKVQSFGLTTLGIIYRNDAYGQGLCDVFKANYSGTITTEIPYVATKTAGFTTEVAALLGSTPPQGLLIIALQNDGTALTWELQAQVLAFPVSSRPQSYFGSDGTYREPFVKSAAPFVIENMHGTFPVHPQSSSWDQFNHVFTSRVGQDPSTSYAAQAYDAIYLIALAMAKGQSNTSAAIVANLGSVSRPSGSPDDVIIHPGEFAKAVQALRSGQSINYEGASGKIDFDNNGDPTSATYAWWRIQGGAYQVLETIAIP
jgi:branched-chain amino acid transport system substrate-binding protein